VIRRPLFAAALALLLIVVGCGVILGVAPHAERGAMLLPAAAIVALVTAIAGAGWGLVALAAGAACTALLPLAQALSYGATMPFTLALYALASLTVLLTVSMMRTRVADLERTDALHGARLHALGDGVLVLDAGARIVSLNRAAERLTGWRDTDARGKPLAQILREAEQLDPPTVESSGAVLAGSARHEAYAFVTSAGEERCVVPIASTLPDGGRVILLRDASEERRLRALIDELWTANRGKDETIVKLSGSRIPAPDTVSTASTVSAPPTTRTPRVESAEPDTQPYAAKAEAMPEERVLMLCDDSDSAFALSMLLGMAGYDVQTAASAPEALQHASRFTPRVALIDTTMRDTDGCAAAKALRELCAGLDLVALTSPGASPDGHALAEAGYAIAVPKTEPLVLKRWLARRLAA